MAGYLRHFPRNRKRQRHAAPHPWARTLEFLAIMWLALVAPGPAIAAEPRTMVFFGDSLTAGSGLDPDLAFPALIGRKLEATAQAWKVVNAGVSGETTAGGLRRVDWVLRQRPDFFIIELGGNDGLRGLTPADSRRNLQGIIDRVRTRFPRCVIVLAGMQMPFNMGPEYREDFATIYPALARQNSLSLIPHLLEGVGGVPELNQPDGIHPTAEGHCRVADNVWAVIKPLL